jgi:hypothetical protein
LSISIYWRDTVCTEFVALVARQVICQEGWLAPKPYGLGEVVGAALHITFVTSVEKPAPFSPPIENSLLVGAHTLLHSRSPFVFVVQDGGAKY